MDDVLIKPDETPFEKLRIALHGLIGLFSFDIDAVDKGDAAFQQPGWKDITA
jgi:hypothetical protein